MNRRKFLRNASIGVGSLLVAPKITEGMNFSKNKYPDTSEFCKRKEQVENGYPAYRFMQTNLYSHDVKIDFTELDFDFTPHVNVYHRQIMCCDKNALYHSVKYDSKGLSLVIDESENLDYIHVECLIMCHEMTKTITFEPTNKSMTKEHFNKLFE